MPTRQVQRDLRTQLGITEAASVGDQTRKTYTRLLGEFRRVMRAPEPMPSASVQDRMLVAFCDRLYLEGRDPSAGQKLMASILFHYPLLLSGS